MTEVDLESVRGEVENWLPAVGLETRYDISDLGRARNARTGYILKSSDGRYPTFTIWNDGKRIKRYIHIAVLEAFVSPRPDGLEGLHANDIKSDCRLTNLYWGTPSQNSFDQVKNGKHPGVNRTNCQTCGDTLEFNGRQRRCVQCSRKSAREWARRHRTRCKRGHRFTPSNTTIRKNGTRRCLDCLPMQLKTECRHGHKFTSNNIYEHKGRRHCRTCRTNNDRNRRAA